MKKIIVLALFLVVNLLNAQNYEIINQLKSSDLEQALKLSEQMKNLTKGSYHLYNFKEYKEENILGIIYAPDGITDEQLKESKSYNNCIVIQFRIFYEDRNLDLNKEGIKKYKFLKIESKYLDIFPVWKSWFIFNADLQKTATDRDLQELIDYDKKIYITIQKNGNRWVLRND